MSEQILPAGGYSTCTFKTFTENIFGCFYCNGSVRAVDGAGSVRNMATNTDYGFHNSGSYFTTSGVTENASNGVLLSGSFGFDGGLTFGPSAIAVDGSGTLWGLADSKLVQYAWLTAPLVTAFSFGVQNHTAGRMPEPDGTLRRDAGAMTRTFIELVMEERLRFVHAHLCEQVGNSRESPGLDKN